MTWAKVFLLLLFRFSPPWRVLGFDFMFVLGFSSVADICSCCSIFENNLPPWWICVDLSDFLHRCYLNQYHMFKFFLFVCTHSTNFEFCVSWYKEEVAGDEWWNEILSMLLDERFFLNFLVLLQTTCQQGLDHELIVMTVLATQFLQLQNSWKESQMFIVYSPIHHNLLHSFPECWKVKLVNKDQKRSTEYFACFTLHSDDSPL